ncbi:hypothetical protein [Actinophytocola sp.]|uniref:hypothetical protein n=1 Tax=Actinophytocola sp. TaxID=1872138 RepID=UPI002D25CD30|nr:hypothetical protein [Actinophytocola sp.]HYQ66140.1 hypothetical protein [Actinophytocola sp.]
MVDKARELTTVGVGINLQPHAVRELTELGLERELAEIGVPIGEVVFCDRFGTRIWGEPRGVGAGYRWPQYAVHRTLRSTTCDTTGRQQTAENCTCWTAPSCPLGTVAARSTSTLLPEVDGLSPMA